MRNVVKKHVRKGQKPKFPSIELHSMKNLWIFTLWYTPEFTST